MQGWNYDAVEFLSAHEYTNVVRWADTIIARPAVQRGRMVNRTWGYDPSKQLRERHEASDFQDEDAGQAVGKLVADYSDAGEIDQRHGVPRSEGMLRLNLNQQGVWSGCYRIGDSKTGLDVRLSYDKLTAALPRITVMFRLIASTGPRSFGGDVAGR